MRALIVIDVQQDFCPGGSLATEKGAEVAQAIAQHVETQRDKYQLIAATKDWHIDPGDHFSETPDFVDSWPVHCVAESPGAAFHPAIEQLQFDEVFYKGAYEAAYSGFEGKTADDTPLAHWLRANDIDIIDVVGIATDHCVKATVLDALENDFEVRVLTDLVAAVSEESGEAALAEMVGTGAQLA